VEDYNPWERRI